MDKAQQTNALIQSIQHAANQTSEASTRISDALREQTATGHLISEQIERISNMTEENTQSVGDVENNIRTLDRLAEDLAQSAARFQA